MALIHQPRFLALSPITFNPSSLHHPLNPNSQPLTPIQTILLLISTLQPPQSLLSLLSLPLLSTLFQIHLTPNQPIPLLNISQLTSLHIQILHYSTILTPSLISKSFKPSSLK
jgi:hypothetical protein